MKFYRVHGTISYENVWYCDCEHCQGHSDGKEVTKEIDEIVKARDEEVARRTAIVKTVHRDFEELDIQLIVEDAPVDVALRKMGVQDFWGD